LEIGTHQGRTVLSLFRHLFRSNGALQIQNASKLSPDIPPLLYTQKVNSSSSCLPHFSTLYLVPSMHLSEGRAATA
jgi:hypothetical protein